MAEIPERFSDRWRRVRKLPGGGQADTFEVEDQQNGQRGVLKIPKNLTGIAVARFRREVEILTSIQHLAIVRLLDWCVDDDALGYVSPLGIPLSSHWPSHAATLGYTERYDTAYGYVHHLAGGLAMLHNAGVVHRDIKPENIIMMSDSAGMRPVLIDFGLAIRPEDERLSLVENRPAANQFAAPPAAYYGKEEPTPAWDCLGLAWIFGWLVGAEPKARRFHWMFHEMIPEDRTNRVRALLAGCQSPSTVPANASEFIARMESLRLGGEPVTSDGRGPDFGAAERAYLEGQALGALRRAEEDELLETCAALLGDFIDDVRRRVHDGLASANQALPIRVQISMLWGTSSNAPPRDVMQTARQHRSAELFMCICGVNPNNFIVTMHLHYDEQPQPGRLPFTLTATCRGQHDGPDRIRLIQAGGGFAAQTDGTWSDGSRRVTSVGVADLVLSWITNEEHWRLVGGDRRQGR